MNAKDFIRTYGTEGWRLLLERGLRLDEMTPPQRDFYEKFLDDLSRALDVEPLERKNK